MGRFFLFISICWRTKGWVMNRAADRLPNAANTFWAIPFLHTVSSAVNGNITNIELNIQR